MRRLAINVNGSLSSGDALNDVPVLVHLHPSRFDCSSSRLVGGDLRFANKSGNLLANEVESWNPNGISDFWVKIPHISPMTSGALIFLYYSNAGATSQEDPECVWSGGYAAVWHWGGEFE